MIATMMTFKNLHINKVFYTNTSQNQFAILESTRLTIPCSQSLISLSSYLFHLSTTFFLLKKWHLVIMALIYNSQLYSRYKHGSI